MSNRIRLYTILPAAILFCLWGGRGDVASAQAPAQTVVFGAAEPGGPVAIFYSGPIGMSEGLAISRMDGEQPVLLTPDAIRPAGSASEFFDRSGLDPGQLMEALEADSPINAFLRLRLDEQMGNLYGIVEPSAARALGRLWIDSTGVPGTYSVHLVDAAGQATSEIHSVEVVARTLAVPVSPRASYSEARVTVSWDYPQGRVEDGDPVTSFRVYEETADGIVAVEDARTLRQIDLTDYSTTISAGVESGVRTFLITAVDFFGRESGISVRASVTIVDDIAPESVSGIEAVPVDSRTAAVAWGYAGEVVDRFEIYRSLDVNGTFVLLGPTAPDVTAYTDTSVEPGNVYHYRVSAIDAAGNASKQTLTASVLIQDFEPPANPSGVTANPNEDGSVLLTWTGVSAPDLNSYVVIRRNVTHDRTQPFAVANMGRVETPTFRDEGPSGLGFEPGAYYEFGVAAADSSSNVSDTVRVTIQIPDNNPPDAPVLTASADDASVVLKWNPSSSPDVTSYQLLRAVAGSVPEGGADKSGELDSGIYPRTFARTVTTHIDRDVSIDDSYVYALTAIDSLGNESTASIDTVQIRRVGRPAPVRNVVASSAANGVTLRWAGTADGGAERYRIYRSNTEGAFSLVGESIAVDTYLDAGGQQGSLYYVTRVWLDGRESLRSRVVGS